MKTINAGLNTHLQGTVTTLATLWEITRRDGTKFYFTDHDQDITFELNVYKASEGFSRTAIANASGGAVDNLDILGVFNSNTITDTDLRAGLFDFAEIKVSIINWSDPTQGVIKMRRGWLGEVQLTELGFFKAELRGMTQVLSQNLGELYSPHCRSDLGDPARCGLPIQPAILGRNQAVTVLDQYGRPTFYRVPTSLPAGRFGTVTSIVNPGFETGDLTGWTPIVGGFWVVTGTAGAITPHTGSFMLNGPGTGTIRQDFTPDVNAADLLAGKIKFRFKWWNNNDQTGVEWTGYSLKALDANNNILATLQEHLTTGQSTTWAQIGTNWNLAPQGTVKLRIEFNTQISGGAGNHTIDDIELLYENTNVPYNQENFENRIYKVLTAGTTAQEQPVYDETIPNDTTDGTAVLEATASYTVNATVTGVIDRRTFQVTVLSAFAADWFNYGAVRWDTGLNKGRVMEVKDFATGGTQTITLFLPMGFNIQVGDKFAIYPGCDKQHTTCATKFNNILNFRGEPYVPGSDFLMSYPQPKG